MRADLTQDFMVSNGSAEARASTLNFRHVRGWIFDLDNTLYPFGAQVLIDAEERICRFIQDHLALERNEAWRLQKECLKEDGATLAGLVRRFKIDPEAYFAFVNDVDVTTLTPAPELARALARLPGRRIVFTNNCGRHAARVLKQLGIAGAFHEICDLRSIGFKAKPAASGYEAVIARAGVPAEACAMFEDHERNLAPAHALGLTTVWIRHPAHGDSWPAHVHHPIDDLTHFLQTIEVRS